MPCAFSPLSFCFCLALLALAGCAGSRQTTALPAVDVATDPYSAFPGAPAAERDVRPVSARITHRGTLPADLTGFLDRLTAAVESGNWNAVALFLDEAGLREQIMFLAESGHAPGRAAAETLAGALGLDTADYPLLPSGADRDAAPFAGLDRVGTITVESVSLDAGTGALVEGYVRLDDRTMPRYSFRVLPTPQGPRVVVPLG